MENEFIYPIFYIFTGAALLATVALFTRQALLIAYILLGVLLGPSGLKWVGDPDVLRQFSDFGIIFLLFLLGLNLPLQNLFRMLRETTLVTLVSSALFGLAAYFVTKLTGFSYIESLVVGVSMMFSSTIIGLKLLPTTILHHQRTGEIVISVLLMQDIIAIFSMLFINAAGTGGGVSLEEAGWILVSLPACVLAAFAVERTILSKAMRRFNRIHEYLFLSAIGWCLACAVVTDMMGLSLEVGAFIGGITLATSPIARFIAENLKPLRDFFLILFFFSLGASIDLHLLQQVLWPALFLAVAMLILKPLILCVLLGRVGDGKQRAMEVGMRLGQASEFSLLVSYMALSTELITESAAYLIQGATVITFIVSSYIIVLRYPTPIAVSDELRRD
ncbi:MAG: sodium:proton antiporter [Legionellales bacterium]|nr:sodium:proton antiporter [Legionellales bacterium]